MVIKKLTLQNFRNYGKETFFFRDGLNVLSGRNAQGKTNCAEAVFYLCTGSPLRIRHEKQLVRFGEEKAYLSAETQTHAGTVKLEAEISENGRALFVNGNKVARFVDFLGHMTSVFFSGGTPSRAGRSGRTAEISQSFHFADLSLLRRGAFALSEDSRSEE